VTDTSCPDESVFAELAAGKLAEADRQAFEAHLDQCADCTELLGFLASPPERRDQGLDEAAVARTSSPSSGWWCRDEGAISLTMLATQLYASALVWWPAVKCAVAQADWQLPWPLRAFVAYLAIAGVLGPLLAALAVIAVWKCSKSSRRLILANALVCIGTFGMAPLALVAMFWLRSKKR
jgi:hypothetical protein